MRWNFQKLYDLRTLVPKRRKKIDTNRSGIPGGPFQAKEKDKDREQPLCLWEPHRGPGIRYPLRTCKGCPAKKKKRLREKIAAKKAKTGPFKSTRSQNAQQTNQQKRQQPPSNATGRLSQIHATDRFEIPLKHDVDRQSCIGRCDDKSIESMASRRLAESAILNVIGKKERETP